MHVQELVHVNMSTYVAHTQCILYSLHVVCCFLSVRLWASSAERRDLFWYLTRAKFMC